MKTLLLSSLLIFALIACKTKKGTAQLDKLENSSWEVVLLNSEIPDSKQTITIIDNSLKGKAACNGFGGKINLTDKNLISISDIVSTKMACPNLSEENTLFQNLRNTTNYKRVKEELSFYNSDNKLLVKLKKIEL